MNTAGVSSRRNAQLLLNLERPRFCTLCFTRLLNTASVSSRRNARWHLKLMTVKHFQTHSRAGSRDPPQDPPWDPPWDPRASLLIRSTGNLSAYPLIDPYGTLIDLFERQPVRISAPNMQTLFSSVVRLQPVHRQPVRISAPNMQTLFQFSSVARLQQNPIDPY